MEFQVEPQAFVDLLKAIAGLWAMAWSLRQLRRVF